ncbi:trichohyalin-like isoform X5 [Mercenaria mercenaria]|uniref:trichohyalin-like isoform X5 n=1 Tax=Mercenaria mercenaria TaxID=6596 RepID=UPI00234FA5E5|nr:trichohyalin-like isoform X5 [Mercenaria mercenaria]
MATGSALNLSLLSRGVGEVTRNGSEKVDVIFEPQDYFNFVEESHDRPFFLPPLQPRYHGFTSEPSQLSSRYSSKDAVHLPKTFTTRKGALLLFSEDMAHRTKAVEAKKHRHQGFHSDRDITLSSLEESSTDRDLKTVDDLAKSILAYGSIDESGNMNLKVMAQRTKKRRYDFERQIRPGFSAKRYLSTWTKTWDDTTLEKVISKGYLTEKSLFYYNPLLPHLSRRLNDDLSHYPTPYKLMRSMLMSPGSLSGYTFYRVRPESQETDYIDISEDEEMRSLVKSRQAGSVKVASVTADGQLKEAIYGQLDRQAQAEVLTDLLVKGAVHYAMKTQQEFAGRILEESEGGSETKVVPKFDMRDAVESMLQANEQKGVPQQMLDADLPERDDRSQHSGSFKGSKLGSHRLHPRGQGDGLQWRDDASSASSGGAAPGPLPTSHAPLPPIGQTYTQLTPIGEASREHTQAFSLPVNEKDGVPQTADSMQPQIGIIPATPQTPAYSTEAQVGVKGVSKDPTFVLEAPEEVAEAFESEDEEGEDWVGRRMVEKPVEQKTHVDGGEEKRRMEMEKRKARVSARSLDLEGIQPKQFAGPPVAAGFSSSESAGPGSTHSSGWLPPVHKQQWKGSQQSLRSHGSRRAYSDTALKGSGRMKNNLRPVSRKTEISFPSNDILSVSSVGKKIVAKIPVATTIRTNSVKSLDLTDTESHVESVPVTLTSGLTVSNQSWLEHDSQAGNQTEIEPGPFALNKIKTAKKSSKSHRTTRTGLSSDIYRITSSETLPVSNLTKTKTRLSPNTRLSSSLSNLSFNKSFDKWTSGTEFDRHSDTDVIKIKIDQADSSESEIGWPITVPVFPKFSVSHSHNSATPRRIKSSKSFGSLYASDDSDAEVPNEWKLQGRQTDIKKLPKREGAGSYDLETEREVWEGLKHTSFVGRKSGMDSGAKSEQAQSVKGMSPERSKSEMKYSPKAQGLQRSHSSPPLSDRSDISGKSRSRPSSEVFKSYRPLQSQLTHLEGETQMIREQTEVSHFTEKEKSELSKQSEKADVTDLKTELTIPDHIEEEGHIEAEVLVEDLQPEVEQVEKQVEEQVEKRAEEVEKHDEEHDEKQDEEKLEKPEEEPVEKLEEEVAQTDEVERKTDEDQEIEADKSVEKKSGEITPKSLRTPSQSASVINDEDVKESPKSRVTEQEIIDKLTSHATHIAESVLSHSESGQLLEEDIRRAAALWMDTHPPRDISRSQSVQDLPDTYVGLRITRLHVMTVIQEVMKVQKRNSAGPTVAEYRDQIKGNLMTALAKATGLKQSDIPQDAEIDPELLEQLASNTLTPDDIEIVRDEETGRSFIRSRNRIITEAMGGVEKGHIYQPAAKKTVQWLNVPTSGDYTHWSRTDGEGGKRVSIPSERKPAEIGELDIITYQGQDDDKQSPKGSKAGSEVGSKKASSGKPKSVSHDGDAKSIKSAASFKDSQGQDELQKALADLEQGGSPTDAHSLKSGKSGKTQKSDDKKSKVSEKKGPSPEKEKKEEFVVGKVQNKKELEELYSQPVHAPEPKESVLAENSIVKDKKEKSMKEKSVVKKSAQSQKSKLSMASKEKTDVKVQKKPKTPATKAKPKSKPDKEPEPDKVEVKVEEPTKTEPAKEVEQKIEPNVLKEKEPPAKDVTAGTRKPKTPAKNTKPKVKIDKGHDQAEVKTETAKKVDKKIEPNVLKEEEPPFKDVTGKPKEKKQTKAAPVGKKKPEKGKKPKGKGKKKEEPAPEPETAMEAVSPVKEKTPEPPKEKTPKSQTPVSERPDNIDTSVNQSTINTSTVITESAKQESDEEEEYIIVRDETMSPEIEQPDVHLNMTTSAEEEEPDEEQISTEDLEDLSEADKLRMISNREARAAKRAAAAEKRRQEVERKRKEREEQIKREKEEHERQEVLRQEQEELRKQKEEERRLKKQREEEENEEQMQEELERQRREKAEVEKERRRKEEYARKLEMMKVKQAEEEKRRQEEAERKRLEEEERRKEEEELMAKMAEEERLEYERKKKLEEEERIRKEEEEKKRREEEAQRALEEARRLAEEMARKQAELEARLRFNRSLQMEANGLEHTQDITKAFVFSYFELLQWLGLDIPEFELLKLNQY